MTPDADFDMQAAWMRRFASDTDSNLRAFALRLKEALCAQPGMNALLSPCDRR
jgi:hypothetical protein